MSALGTPGEAAERLYATAADCWGCTESARLDGWQLRAGSGFTHRANSAWTLGPLERPLTDALAEVHAWYAERGLEPLIHSVVGSDLDARLVEHGCGDGVAAALRQTADVASVLANLEARTYPNVPVSTAPRPQDRWLRLYRAGEVPPVAKEILGAGDERYCYATVYDERSGEPLSIGRAVLTGDAHSWVGLAGIETAVNARRRGLAHLIVKTLLDWAQGRGARQAMLEVTAANEGAISLYRKLGFATAHTYHYRPAPPPRQASNAALSAMPRQGRGACESKSATPANEVAGPHSA